MKLSPDLYMGHTCTHTHISTHIAKIKQQQKNCSFGKEEQCISLISGGETLFSFLFSSFGNWDKSERNSLRKECILLSDRLTVHG